MSEVIKFSAPGVLHASERVQEFIDLARTGIDVLVSHEQWHDDIWHVGHVFITKGQNRDTRTLAFYNYRASISRKQDVTGEPLHPAFIDFAKAYSRWMHAARPVSFENTRKRLDALQLIEAGFRRFGLVPAIENLNVSVLNAAVEIARDGVGAGRHYQFAIYVQQIHRLCMDRKFLKAPFPWKHGIRKPKDRTEELGGGAKDWREKRLPSPESFHALAHVFRHAETFSDRLFSAVCAICISIPIRAHEVLQLRVDCEVHAQAKSPDTGEMIDTYGIRVWPGKDNPPQVKWVPGHMITVVQEAVGRLMEMCSDGRNVAAWYEANPDQLFLPPDLQHYRTHGLLPISAICSIIGLTDGEYLRAWLRKRGVDVDAGEAKIEPLAAALIEELPRNFPFFNGDPAQPYSKTLIVLLKKQAHSTHRYSSTVIEQATVGAFNDWLNPHVSTPNKRSVFDRWGFVERDGLGISITSHAFRHWLNTVAQFRGMSELDIAKWSGRDVAQNKAYNHVTPEEILSQIRNALDDGNAVGPMFEAAKAQGVNTPVDRRDFIDAQIGSALVTDYGICVHDYSLLPCQSHGDCLGCSENVFVKGDAEHKVKVEKRLETSERQLALAVEATGDSIYGADRWVESHSRAIARQRIMLATHADDGIPDGTIVNLPDGALDNEVAMALRDRDALSTKPAKPEESPTAACDPDEMSLLSAMWED